MDEDTKGIVLPNRALQAFFLIITLLVLMVFAIPYYYGIQRVDVTVVPTCTPTVTITLDTQTQEVLSVETQECK